MSRPERWRPGAEDRAAVEAVRQSLAAAVERSGLSRREIDRRAGWTENYLSQVLRDAADLKVAHVVAVLRAIGVSPAEFFVKIYMVVDGPTDEELLGSLASAMERYEDRLKAVESELEQRRKR
jgi:lambda repressor-like predicted transcriptional regulator